MQAGEKNPLWQLIVYVLLISAVCGLIVATLETVVGYYHLNGKWLTAAPGVVLLVGLFFSIRKAIVLRVLRWQ